MLYYYYLLDSDSPHYLPIANDWLLMVNPCLAPKPVDGLYRGMTTHHVTAHSPTYSAQADTAGPHGSPHWAGRKCGKRAGGAEGRFSAFVTTVYTRYLTPRVACPRVRRGGSRGSSCRRGGTPSMLYRYIVVKQTLERRADRAEAPWRQQPAGSARCS